MVNRCTDGVQDLVDHYQLRSRQITVFAGLWHTHPDHPAMPSPTDEAGMQQLLADGALASPALS
jgi:proteasome lid subunit RPN8/RPN11